MPQRLTHPDKSEREVFEVKRAYARKKKKKKEAMIICLLSASIKWKEDRNEGKGNEENIVIKGKGMKNKWLTKKELKRACFEICIIYFSKEMDTANQIQTKMMVIAF